MSSLSLSFLSSLQLFKANSVIDSPVKLIQQLLSESPDKVEKFGLSLTPEPSCFRSTSRGHEVGSRSDLMNIGGRAAK